MGPEHSHDLRKTGVMKVVDGWKFDAVARCNQVLRTTVPVLVTLHVRIRNQRLARQLPPDRSTSSGLDSSCTNRRFNRSWPIIPSPSSSSSTGNGQHQGKFVLLYGSHSLGVGIPLLPSFALECIPWKLCFRDGHSVRSSAYVWYKAELQASGAQAALRYQREAVRLCADYSGR